MKPNETLKQWTRELVLYMDIPPEERRAKRVELRARRKSTSEPWSVRWFGQVPLALSMWFKQLASFGSRQKRTLRQLARSAKIIRGGETEKEEPTYR